MKAAGGTVGRRGEVDGAPHPAGHVQRFHCRGVGVGIARGHDGIGRGVDGVPARLSEVVHVAIAHVPDIGRGVRGRAHRTVAVVEVDGRVRGGGQRRDPHPGHERSGDAVVLLHLPVEEGEDRVAERDVVGRGALDVAAVRRQLEGRVGDGDEDREVEMRGARCTDLGPQDRDLPSVGQGRFDGWGPEQKGGEHDPGP